MDTVPVVTSWADARPDKLLGNQACLLGERVCGLIANIDTKFNGLYEQLLQHMTTLKSEYATMKARLDEMIAAGVPEDNPDRQALESSMGETGTQLETLKKQLEQLPGIFEKVSGNLEKMRVGAASLAKVDEYEITKSDGEALTQVDSDNLQDVFDNGKKVMEIVMSIYRLRENMTEEMVQNNFDTVKGEVDRIVALANAYFGENGNLVVPEITAAAILNTLHDTMLPNVMGKQDEQVREDFLIGLMNFLFDHATSNNIFLWNLLEYLYTIAKKHQLQIQENYLNQLGYIFQSKTANPVVQKQEIVKLMGEILHYTVKISQKSVEHAFSPQSLDLPGLNTEYRETIMLLLGVLEYMNIYPQPQNQDATAEYITGMTAARQKALELLQTLYDKVPEFKTRLENILKSMGVPRYESLDIWRNAFASDDESVRKLGLQSMYYALQAAVVNKVGSWETLHSEIAEAKEKYSRQVPVEKKN